MKAIIEARERLMTLADQYDPETEYDIAAMVDLAADDIKDEENVRAAYDRIMDLYKDLKKIRPLMAVWDLEPIYCFLALDGGLWGEEDYLEGEWVEI